MTKRLTKLVALVLALVMCTAVLTACPGPQDKTNTTVTYNSYTTVMPSNWNEFTYADGNDTQIMSYIGSSFFEYDYKFENDQKFLADGSINKAGIVSGGFTTNYSAATKLEDVTGEVDAKWGYTPEQIAEGGYAWKITLRNDLKWHDGTAITAADFEYSMKELLNPDFMNYRANTYYQSMIVKGAREYFFQNQEGVYETPGSRGFDSLKAATDAGKALYIKPSMLFAGLETMVDQNGKKMPEWIDLTTIYGDPDEWAAGEAYFCGQWIIDKYLKYIEVGGAYESAVGLFIENAVREWAWEDVGVYAIEAENAIVVCLATPIAMLKEDGSLSYHAAYEFGSLPLVKKDLYESCKQAPAEGSTLWTSNYNSSFDTTASWGPYMLVQFEAGSHFMLKKNPNWYGWGLETNKGQYKVDALYTRKIEEPSTAWMGFLAGELDDGALTIDNIEEYKDSKYVTYAPETGTYGMQLYSNLPVLKASDNNNGILAILEFRQAFNLALDRADVVDKIWPGTAAPCFGLMSDLYYYDVENAATLVDGGSYRNSAIAKAGILRAYGYEQAADGTWSINDLTGLDLDDAYETLTGYNLTLAKEKATEAYNILTANAEDYGYDDTKKITLVYGSSVDNSKQRDRCTYLQGVVDAFTAGTPLEGKIELVFDASAGDGWADAFRSGQTQIGFGYGFQGNVFDPFDIVGGFVNPDDTNLNYHAYWDTSAIDMTLTLPAGDYEGAGETITMDVQNWYYCLNGLAENEGMDYTYNWGDGYAPAEARLMILSALEELTIKESRSVMLITGAGGSLLGAKFSHFHDEYSVFMGFGGLRYMVINYNDGEWAEYVESMNGNLSSEYKKSE